MAGVDAVDTAIIAAPFGQISVSVQGDLLIGIDFVTGPRAECIPHNPVLREAARQLARYFESSAARFDLPLRLNGTAYRERVWQALVDIPAGSSETYGSLARRLGSGARAIAAACRANAFPIIIPCHRVVAVQGLGGYCGQISGPFLEIKHWLLRHEGCALD